MYKAYKKCRENESSTRTTHAVPDRIIEDACHTNLAKQAGHTSTSGGSPHHRYLQGSV